MDEGGRRQLQEPVEVQLPGRGGQQVRPPDHLRHTHGGVVHYYRQLIGEHAVGPAEEKVSAVLRQLFRVMPHVPVDERKFLVRHLQAKGRGAVLRPLFPLRGGQAPAGPGVDGRTVLPVGSAGGVELRPGAEAGILFQFSSPYFMS